MDTRATPAASVNATPAAPVVTPSAASAPAAPASGAPASAAGPGAGRAADHVQRRPRPGRSVVLITGATSGIGRHAALALAQDGHHVIATGRRRAALESLAREAEGLLLDTLELDVTRAESIERVRAEVDQLTGGHGVDALVNNAGYGMAAPAIETTDEDLRRQFETNVFGLMAMTRAFAPAMMARRSGRIINITSVGARITFPFFGAYSASKYAVESLSDALRRELAPFGVQVTLVEPGPIRTEFADRSMEYVAKYRNAASPYAAIYERAERIREATDRQAVGPEHVTRAIEHAVTARRARPRYVTPFGGRVLLWLNSWMPTRWMDFLQAARARADARQAQHRALKLDVGSTTPALVAAGVRARPASLRPAFAAAGFVSPACELFSSLLAASHR